MSGVHNCSCTVEQICSCAASTQQFLLSCSLTSENWVYLTHINDKRFRFWGWQIITTRRCPRTPAGPSTSGHRGPVYDSMRWDTRVQGMLMITYAHLESECKMKTTKRARARRGTPAACATPPRTTRMASNPSGTPRPSPTDACACIQQQHLDH